jgi:hypothetical protein
VSSISTCRTSFWLGFTASIRNSFKAASVAARLALIIGDPPFDMKVCLLKALTGQYCYPSLEIALRFGYKATMRPSVKAFCDFRL